jgi:hypothetical protein
MFDGVIFRLLYDASKRSTGSNKDFKIYRMQLCITHLPNANDDMHQMPATPWL